VREFLSDNGIRFDDRNIRKSEAARAELATRTGALVLPQLFWRDRHVVGFDQDALEKLADAYRAAVT
jgi:glutaredoxin